MAGKSIISRVGHLEKAIKEANIKLEKLDEKLKKFTEMEKTVESLTQSLARISSALEDKNKKIKSTVMNTPTGSFNSELTLGDRKPTEESAVTFQSTHRWDGLREDYLLEEALMDHQTFIYLPSYPDLGPKEKLLKIKGKIKGKEVVVLIKEDTTHNFVSEDLVQEIGLPLLVTRDYMVLTDVTSVLGDSICMYVSLELPGFETKAHFVPLELVDGVDVIMGRKWLDTLEDVKIYNDGGICKMKFVEGSDVIMWEADPNL